MSTDATNQPAPFEVPSTPNSEEDPFYKAWKAGMEAKDDIKFSIEIDAETNSQTITASKTICYAARLSPGPKFPLDASKIKEILAERIKIGMRGFDQAISNHDAKGDGERINFRILPEEEDGDWDTRPMIGLLGFPLGQEIKKRRNP